MCDAVSELAGKVALFPVDCRISPVFDWQIECRIAFGKNLAGDVEEPLGVTHREVRADGVKDVELGFDADLIACHPDRTVVKGYERSDGRFHFGKRAIAYQFYSTPVVRVRGVEASGECQTTKNGRDLASDPLGPRNRRAA